MSIIVLQSRVAEVVRGHRGTPKSLDSDENFKPEHTLFCRELRYCDYAQERRICCEIVNTRFTKISMAIFVPDERLPSSATLHNAYMLV